MAHKKSLQQIFLQKFSSTSSNLKSSSYVIGASLCCFSMALVAEACVEASETLPKTRYEKKLKKITRNKAIKERENTQVKKELQAPAALSDAPAPTTSLTFNGGGSQSIGGLIGSDPSSQIEIGSSDLTLTVPANTTNTFAGTIIDDSSATAHGKLIKSGDGTQVFSGANTYSGGTEIDGGTLSISADNNLGDANSHLTINGSTLEITDTITSDRSISLTNNGTILVDADKSATLGGVIDSTGALVKEGPGTLKLTGSNSYSGGTTVSSGTLTGNAYSLKGNITNNASVVFDSTTNGTYAGSMSGTGSLESAGSLTLTGLNSYSGGTTVSGGTLTGNTDSLKGSIENNAAIIFDQGSNGTFIGSITGAGSVEKDGSGVLTTSGTNSYSGGTKVSSGTLTGNTSSLQGNIENNAAIIFDQEGDGTFIGSITGTGSVEKDGSGALTTSGANSYSGGTTLREGTLVGTTTSLQGDITSIEEGTVVDFLDSTNGTYTGILSGPTALHSEGKLTLSGENTYSGGTVINFGTVTISSDSNLGDATKGITMGNSVLKSTEDAQMNRDITINSLGQFSVDPEKSLTLDGTISGTGILQKIDEGTLILKGNNSYAKTNAIGGTLVGDADSLSGDLQVNAKVVFDQENDTSYSGNISGFGPIEKKGSGNLTLSGVNSCSGEITVTEGTLTGTADNLQIDITNNANVVFSSPADGTYSRSMSGTGSLEKKGSGNLTLTGVNTYQGGTVVNGGTLSVRNDSNLGDPSGTVAINGSTLEITDNTTGSRNVSLKGSGTILVDAGKTATLLGAISDGAATGSLTKDGAGTLVLKGANTYSEGTTVLAGVLTGTTESLKGDITNNASVVFDLTTNGTYAGKMDGPGRLESAGDLTLTGSNSYSGGTTVSGRTLTGNANSLQGNIENNGAIIFDQESDGTYSGKMSGSGSVEKSGSGNLTLTGSNSYAGGTTISGGTLIGNTDSLQGDISNNASVVFDSTTNGTYTGHIEGTGSLESAGNLTLTGSNSYSGGTLVSNGTLSVSNDSNLGDLNSPLAIKGSTLKITDTTTTNRSISLASSGTILVDAGKTATLLGALSDGIVAGSLTKDGAGTLILKGANTYSNGTTVSSGTLTGNTDSLRGNISNDASVVFDSTTNGTYTDKMSGSGSLESVGNLTLAGDNSYSGGTLVSGGILSVSKDNNLGDPNGAVAINGSTLEITDNATGSRNFSLAGSGTILVDAGKTATLLGALGDGIVAGSLTKDGAGTLILKGANTYSNGTTVSSGTLTGNTDSLRGNISNDASVVFDSTTNGTYTDKMSGTGSLESVGNLTLAGDNSYSGGTLVSGGILSVSKDNNLGDPNGAVAINGSTLKITDTATTNRSISLTNAGTVLVDAGKTATLLGALSDGIVAGSLTKDGAGALLLKGVNTYSNGTTVSSGTLTGNTDSLRGDISNDASVVFDSTTNGTYTDKMSGSGSLESVGNLTLAGDNSYSGGTLVSGGTLSVSKDNNLGDPNGAVAINGSTLKITDTATTNRSISLTNAGTVLVDAGKTATLLGALSDRTAAGSLTKDGAGTLILKGANTYSNGTTVSSGTLIGNTNSLQGNITNNASVVFDSTTNGTYTGNIGGTGSLESVGNLTLAGGNSYSGGTLVSGGTLSISNDSNLGNASGSLTINDSTFKATGGITNSRSTIISGSAVINADDSLVTLNGVISDGSSSGSLTKEGTGELVLGGTNTYSGATTVNAGTLTISKAENLGSVSTSQDAPAQSLSINNAKFRVNAGDSNVEIARDVSLAGEATFSIHGSNPSINPQTGAILSGTISGTGSLSKIATGTLTLSADNTYTGGTHIYGDNAISTGGVLSISKARNLGYTDDTQSVTGDLELRYGTLELTGDVSSNGKISINTQGTILADAGTNSVLSGIIDGSGALTKDGQGTLKLSGSNTYQGGTVIKGGTISISSDGQLGDASGGITFGASAVLQTTGDLTSSRSMASPNGAGIIVNNDLTTLAGVLSGAGSFAKGGQGTLVLSGTNTYEGGTVIGAGTLSVSADNNLGKSDSFVDIGEAKLAITGGAFASTRDISLLSSSSIISVDPYSAATLTGVLKDRDTSRGSLVKEGSGALILSNTNTYTNGTVINGGTLYVSSDANLGDVSGSLTINDGGVLETTGSFTSNRSTFLSGSAAINVEETITTTLSGTIGDGDAAGSLAKYGQGSLILSGASIYSGGTTINAGTLSGNTNNLRGIVNVGSNSTLEFDQNVTGTFSGSLSGDGTLSKKGSGILTLNQSSTIGHVVVESGKLSIGPTNNPNSNLLTADNNTLIVTHDVLVKNGATLGGSGKISGTINIESGGKVAPGNSIGPITVTQDLSLTSGSVLEMEISPDLTHDNLQVQGVLTIDAGAVLDVQPQETVNLYNVSQHFTIIEADAINGQFGTVKSTTMPSFNPRVTYVPLLSGTGMLGASNIGSIQVTLGADPLTSHGFGGNAGIIAQTSTLNVGSVASQSDLYNALMPIWFISDVEEIRGALNQLHPSLFTGISLVQESSTLHASRTFAKRADSLARSASCSKESANTLSSVWADTSEHKLSQASKGEETGFKSHGFSQTIGVDRRVSENALVGAGFTYDHSKIVWKNSRGKGTTQSYSASLYSNWSKGSFFTNTVLTGGRSKNAATRRIKYGTGPVNVTDRSASHTNSTGVFSAHMDIGYGFSAGGLTVTPFGGLDYISGKDHHFTEGGAQSLDLSVASANTHMLRSEAGFELEKSICTPNAKWTPYMALSFARESRAKSGANRTLTFVETGESATVQGLYPSRNIFKPVIGLSSSFLGSKIHTDLEYSGEFSKGSFNHNVRFEFGYKF